MQKRLIDYDKTGYFTNIVTDYLSGLPELKKYYRLPFEKASFSTLLKERKLTAEQREVLVTALEKQYESGGISPDQFEKVRDNISLLRKDTTFTITTGHQLCLFTGPLYFIYKLFSVINLCEELKKEHTDHDFVPVYWMASEDHDFEEINHFYLFGKKLEWTTDHGGAVGQLSTATLRSCYNELKEVLGESEPAKQLLAWFEDAYFQSEDLADATRILVNRIFHQYGLVCLDANDALLKSQFKTVMQSDLTEHVAFQEVTKTNTDLEKNYKIQVNPREINLFYLKPGTRERLIEDKGRSGFHLSESGESFDREELLWQLDEHPERFSPNVVLRPLYQETILPNLAYIGGGGEIAYWLQLKSLFDRYQLSFPVLVLRNSALWVDKTSFKKLKKNDINDIELLFLPSRELIKEYAQGKSAIDMDFKGEEEAFAAVFDTLRDKAAAVDKSLLPAIKAEQQKINKMLAELKGRLIKAEKKNHETGINQLTAVKEKLFPNGGLQERSDNFAALYLLYGAEFFEILKESLDPFVRQFIVFSEEAL